LLFRLKLLSLQRVYFFNTLQIYRQNFNRPNKMDKNLTIKERILTFIEKKGITKSHFFDITGISASNFKGVNLKSQIGGDALVRILTEYPDVNPQWLILGDGDMLLSSECSKKKIINTTDVNIGIPLIPFDAMAGALTGEQVALNYECERYVVPAFRNADFLMRITGISMQPTYLSGDIVACKRVPMNDIFFQWGSVYVLDTDQGALIKRINPGVSDDVVRICSDNPNFAPFELPMSAIHAIALVVGLIRTE
jgi:phage repressor protein C with HTH and peptisase S24 domain